MAHAQKPDFFFRRNGRVHLNRRGLQFSRLLAAEVCASAVVMLDTPRSELVWRVLVIHSIPQFPLHFSSRASPCAITFQLESTICVTCVRSGEWMDMSRGRDISTWGPIYLGKEGCLEGYMSVTKNQCRCHLTIWRRNFLLNFSTSCI